MGNRSIKRIVKTITMEDKRNYKGCPFDEPIDYSFKKESVDKEKAMALVEKHQFSGMFKQNAIEHSKLDLQHSIEENLSVIEMLKIHGNERCVFAVEQRLNDLHNQLEHLNSI